MRLTTALLPLLSLPLVFSAETETEYLLTNECKRKTQRGDSISVHYTGTLASDGSVFDTSYKRGKPLTFTVGQGQVIKGWDEGLLDMCIGDKRKLTIPPEEAYGNRAMGQIPPNSRLGKWKIGCWRHWPSCGGGYKGKMADVVIPVFETELMDIVGVNRDEL